MDTRRDEERTAQTHDDADEDEDDDDRKLQHRAPKLLLGETEGSEHGGDEDDGEENLEEANETNAVSLRLSLLVYKRNAR